MSTSRITQQIAEQAALKIEAIVQQARLVEEAMGLGMVESGDALTKPSGTSKATLKDLYLSPVPKAMADYLRSKSKGDRDLFRYGFNFLSHLLAFSSTPGYWKQGHIVKTPARKALADCINDKTLTKRTEELKALGIIEQVEQGGFDPTKGRTMAHTYRIGQNVVQHWLTANEPQRYATPRNYQNRTTYKATPCQDLDPSFGAMPVAFQDIKGIVQRLQRDPLRFDWRAACNYTGSLPQSEQRKLWPILHGLSDGPNYTQYTLATSGRLYTKSINFQGIPKRIRKFFYPSTADHVFLDLDFKTQEPRIIAYFSQDKDLLSVLETGDIYKLLADHLGVDRDEAKPLVNGYFYGAWDKGLARIFYGLDEDATPSAPQTAQGQIIRKFMDSSFPTSAAWIRKTTKEIKKTRTAEPLGGGIIRTDILQDEARTQGVNHIGQGTGAVILWLVLRELEVALQGLGQVVLPMHDGLLIEVRRDRAEEVRRVAVDIMEAVGRRVLGGTTIPVEGKWGWQDKGEPEGDLNKVPSSPSQTHSKSLSI